MQAAATAAGKERLKLLRRYPMIGVLTIANIKRIKKSLILQERMMERRCSIWQRSGQISPREARD